LLLDRELKPDPVIERKLAEAKERQKSPRVPQKVASSSQNQIHTSIQDQVKHKIIFKSKPSQLILFLPLFCNIPNLNSIPDSNRSANLHGNAVS